MNTRDLLLQLVSTFESQKAELEEFLKELEMFEPQEYYAASADPIIDIATFDPAHLKPISPMLQARFELFGLIVQGPDHWISLQQIQSVIASNEISQLHTSLRDDWDDSIPSRFADRNLSIFGYTPGVFDEVVYLAWHDSNVEPIVAQYKSGEVYEFSNLDEYVLWTLNRE